MDNINKKIDNKCIQSLMFFQRDIENILKEYMQINLDYITMNEHSFMDDDKSVIYNEDVISIIENYLSKFSELKLLYSCINYFKIFDDCLAEVMKNEIVFSDFIFKIKIYWNGTDKKQLKIFIIIIKCTCLKYRMVTII